MEQHIEPIEEAIEVIRSCGCEIELSDEGQGLRFKIIGSTAHCPQSIFNEYIEKAKDGAASAGKTLIVETDESETP
jgi:hypothetical protein